MLETRLEMQRAKLESIARARLKREDELAVAPAGAADLAGLSPNEMADLLPSIDSAEPGAA